MKNSTLQRYLGCPPVFVSLFPIVPSLIQKKVRAKTKRLEKSSLSLPQCIDLTGPKSIARQTMEGMDEDSLMAVDKRIKTKVKATLNNEVKAALLDEKHRQLLATMNCEYRTKAVAPVNAMVHKLKPTLGKLLGTQHAIKVRDWVEVLYEYAPGTCSDGGIGEIFQNWMKLALITWCDVAYVLDHCIEKYINQSRITVTMMPYKDATSTKRGQRTNTKHGEEDIQSRIIEPPNKTPLEWLKSGLSSRTHEKSGWLKEKLLQHHLMEANAESLWKRVISDYKCQLAAIEGMRHSLGKEFKDPRDYRGSQGDGNDSLP
jgi:hypothetical protein